MSALRAKIPWALEKRGVIAHENGSGPLAVMVSNLSLPRKAETHTTIPVSIHPSAEGITGSPFSSRGALMSVAHNKVAIVMKSAWFAKFTPAHVLRKTRKSDE